MVSKRARGWANQAGMPSQAITQNGSKQNVKTNGEYEKFDI